MRDQRWAGRIGYGLAWAVFVAVWSLVLYCLTAFLIRVLGRMPGGFSAKDWISLAADLVALALAAAAGVSVVSGHAAYQRKVRPALTASGFTPLREVMARGSKRPTILEHGRPPRPEAWKGPHAYLVARPEMRDEIGLFVEQAQNGGLGIVVGDWGTGKTVAVCEAGHHLLGRCPAWAVYHTSIELISDPDRAHEAVDLLRAWLGRWPVRWLYRCPPVLIVEDFHRDFGAAAAVVPRLVEDANAIVLATTRSERGGPGSEEQAQASTWRLPSGREMVAPVQLRRLADHETSGLVVELTRRMYEEMAPKVIAQVLAQANSSDGPSAGYTDAERAQWIRLSQYSLLFVAAMARAAKDSTEHLSPVHVFRAALDELRAVLMRLDGPEDDHARAGLVVTSALVYGLQETPVHEDFLIKTTGLSPAIARGRLEELASAGRLVRWPSSDRKHWYGLPHSGVAELIWRLVASVDGYTDSLLTALREVVGSPDDLGPAVRRSYLRWLEGGSREQLRQHVRQGLAARLVPRLAEDAPVRLPLVTLSPGQALDALREGSHEERYAAVQLLGWLRDPAQVDALITLLGSTESDVRGAAAAALRLMKVDAAIAPLEEVLAGATEPEVRVDVVFALAAIDGPLEVPVIGRALTSDPHPRVRGAAAYALGEIGGEAGAAYLISAVGELNYEVRVWLAAALEKTGVPQAVDVAVAILTQRKHLVLMMPGEYKRGTTEGIGALVQSMLPADHRVRTLAENIRRRLGPMMVTPLIERLGDQVLRVRAAAAEALGDVRDARAVDALIDSSRDANRDVRWAATWALGLIGDAAAVDALVERLSDEYNIRVAATRSLGYIGDRALPALEERFASASDDGERATLRQVIARVKHDQETTAS